MTDATPSVQLLDARTAALDQQDLRHRARAISATQCASFATRSYRYPYALIAWHSDRVGIDIERVEACDPSFARSICTPEEQIDWAALADPDQHLSSLWSSKEALAKALGDAVSYDPRRLASPIFWSDGRAGCWRASELAVAHGYVAWLVWRDAGQHPPRPARPEQDNADLPLTALSPPTLTITT